MANAHYKETMLRLDKNAGAGLAYEDESSLLVKIIPVGRPMMDEVILEESDIVGLVSVGLKILSDDSLSDLESLIYAEIARREKEQ